MLDPMSLVLDLVPGDLVSLGGDVALFVAQAEHPLWPNLRLVVWKLEDGRWSHDALDARQFVGTAQPTTQEQRTTRLRAALIGATGL